MKQAIWGSLVALMLLLSQANAPAHAHRQRVYRQQIVQTIVRPAYLGNGGLNQSIYGSSFGVGYDSHYGQGIIRQSYMTYPYANTYGYNGYGGTITPCHPRQHANTFGWQNSANAWQGRNLPPSAAATTNRRQYFNNQPRAVFRGVY